MESWQTTARDHGEQFTEDDWLILVQELAPTRCRSPRTDDALSQPKVTGCPPDRPHPGIPAVRTAVVWPCEAHALEGPVDAEREQIIEPVLIGNAARIRAVAGEAGLDLGGCPIDVATEAEAAAAVAMVGGAPREPSRKAICTPMC